MSAQEIQFAFGNRLFNMEPFDEEGLIVRLRNGEHSLLTDLFDLAKIPEYQYRHHWYNHTMVLWDNRSVQHYAVHDYWPQRRHMERITVQGDRPFGTELKAGPATLRNRKSPHPEGVEEKYGGHAPKRKVIRDLEKA